MSQFTRQQGNKPTPLRVLIADDIQATLYSARLMFTLIPGVEVVSIARTGREAIKLAKEYQPDIVLMDVNMPEVTGTDAAKAMRKIYPKLVCIIMSSEGDSHTRQLAKEAGARAFLVKPFTTEQLLNTVKPIIESIRTSRERPPQTRILPQLPQTDALRPPRQAQLEKLASEYQKKQRTDDKSVTVFEELAVNPDCNLRWLKALAIIYVVRMEWVKLKILAGRLERQTTRAR